MEFEQIIKQLEWLDEERRKDKATIAALKERLVSLDGNLNTLDKQVKGLSKDLSNLSPVAARINQFDEFLAQQRNDMNRTIEELEKKHHRRERDASKRYQTGLDEQNRTITELRTSINTLELKKSLKAREEEDIRLNKAIGDLKQKVEDTIRSTEDVQHSYQLIENSRRQDSKRLADTQGEMSAIRKRIDEHREKFELYSDNLRNLDSRINELLAAEAERKQAQTTFQDQQSLAQVERDRSWKAWGEKFDAYKKQTENLDTQLLALDEATRVAKRTQETFSELNQRLERRINEITEVQRLSEERIRQEWVTFKSDDQKRWAGFTLSQDESMRDLRKTLEKMEERITILYDTAQTLTDLLQQTTDTTEQQMQELMNWAHDWLSAYERIMEHTHKRG